MDSVLKMSMDFSVLLFQADSPEANNLKHKHTQCPHADRTSTAWDGKRGSLRGRDVVLTPY